MRHASIQTTMNVYGKAMSGSKRDASSNVVKMILKSKKADAVDVQSDQIAGTGS
jgi:integrase